MLFLPNDDALEAQAKSIIDEVVAAEGLKVLGYRKVPVVEEVVGRFAKATQPRIWQVRYPYERGIRVMIRVGWVQREHMRWRGRGGGGRGGTCQCG